MMILMGRRLVFPVSEPVRVHITAVGRTGMALAAQSNSVTTSSRADSTGYKV